MKLNTIKKTIIILFVCSSSYSKGIGTFFIGQEIITKNNKIQYHYTSYSDRSHSEEYRIQSSGILLGFLLPIVNSSINVDFKFSISFHDVIFNETIEWDDYFYEDTKNFKYISGTNAFLISKAYKLSKHIVIQPSIGLGIMGDAIIDNLGRSSTYIEYPIKLTYEFKYFNTGLMFNYKKYYKTNYEFQNQDSFVITCFIAK